MEGDRDNPSRVLKPRISLIDGGALWSVMNTLSFTPSIRCPNQAHPDSEGQSTQQEEAVRSMNNQIMAYGSVYQQRETEGKDRHSDLQALRNHSRSPELFEEFLLGKNSRKKSKKLNTEEFELGRMEESTTNTGTDEDQVTMESGGSQDSSDDGEGDLSSATTNCADADSETTTANSDLLEGGTKKKLTKAKKRTTVSDDLDYTVESADLSDTETDNTNVTDYVTAGLLPFGYDTRKRRSERLEARSLGGVEQQTTRRRVNPEEPAPRRRRSSESTPAANKRPRAASIFADALSNVSKKSASKLGTGAKKTQNNIGRYSKNVVEREKDEIKTIDADSTPIAIASPSPGSIFDLNDLDLRDISKMPIEQSMVILGLFKNANKKLEKEVEEKECRRDQLVESNRILAKGLKKKNGWYTRSYNT